MKNQNCVICDTDSFIVHVKTDDIYEKIAEDVETRLYNLNYKLNRPLPTGKRKKVILFWKDELGRKIMKKTCRTKGKNL